MTSSRKAFLAGLTAATALAAPDLFRPAEAANGTASLANLRSLLGIDPKYAGKGLTIDCGLVYPLTGSGAIYGDRLMDLPHLAARHIERLGGPKLNLIVKDNKSGDPDAGVEATRELGAQHVGMSLSSYAADLGAQIPELTRFKIFTIDGTGGTSLFAVDKPYFWGSIAKTPTDAIPGIVKFLQRKMPQVKRAAFCGWDLGPLSNIIADDAKKYFARAGIELVADERTAIAETDYGSNIQKIKESNPDVIFIPMYAEDPGYFLKQYALSGIDKPVFAFADTIAARLIADTAYENVYFAFDYFDAVHPQNPWASFFVSEFLKMEPGYRPDCYAANTYEDFFTLWDCIRRVLKRGGNPRDGVQLDAALRANPTFKTLYGGTANSVGLGKFDLADHSVEERPMRVLQYKDAALKTLAYFDLGGGNFRFAT